MCANRSIPAPLQLVPDSPTRPNCTIAVLGARSVGKSALATRVCGGGFLSQYNPTTTSLTCRIPLVVDACAWDVKVVDAAGSDGSANISIDHIVGVDAYVLTFSLLSKRSLRVARRINARLLEDLAEPISEPEIARVLVGTHGDVDQDLRQVDSELANATAKDLHVPFVEASALTGDGCTSAFIAAVRLFRDGVPKLSDSAQLSQSGEPSSPDSQTDSKQANSAKSSSWTTSCVLS